MLKNLLLIKLGDTMKKYSLSLMIFVASGLAVASPDPAYVKQQVQETINGSMQNANRYAQEHSEELNSIVATSNRNKAMYQQDALQIANASNSYLQSENAKKDQAWGLKTQEKIMQNPKYHESQKVGLELCRNAQQYSDIQCPER